MVGLLLLQAIIIFGSGDPEANASPPTGNLTNSGWQYIGQWNGFCGVPIYTNAFLAAAHVGGAVGDSFYFDGQSYQTIRVQRVPSAQDINLWKVAGTFPRWAPLFENGIETNRPAIFFGRGTQRGSEVWMEGVPRIHPPNSLRVDGLPPTPTTWQVGDTNFFGWRWGSSDGRLRWGTNVLIFGTFGRLGCIFGPGYNTCQVSVGDSSGACFVQDDDGAWKLAGMISYVAGQGPYSEQSESSLFSAAVIRSRGLYANGQKIMAYDTPSWSYITRIGQDLMWVKMQAGIP